MKLVRFSAMMIVAFILAACAPVPTPTPVPTPVPPAPTPVPPTATRVPPTATTVPTVASSAASSASTSASPVTIELGAGRDGNQAGIATLTAKDDKTEVLLSIKPGAAGVAQPAHIHVGQCPVPGAVKYPLSNVVDGKSLTTLNVKLADLLAGGFAINVHLSTAEASKYVACGDLKVTSASASTTASSASSASSAKEDTGYGK